jgi:hypothetical protein
VDAVADEDTTSWVLVGVGAKLLRMGCAVMDGSHLEKQAAGPMRDQRCLSKSGSHGVEKQSGGMQWPSATDWGCQLGEIMRNLDNGEEDRTTAEAHSRGRLWLGCVCVVWALGVCRPIIKPPGGRPHSCGWGGRTPDPLRR